MDLNATYAVDKRSGQTDTVASFLTFTGNNSFTGNNTHTGAEQFDDVVVDGGISCSFLESQGDVVVAAALMCSITNSTTYSGLVTCDYSLTNTYVVGPITGATTVYIKNATPGQSLYLVIIQDGIGHVVTFQTDSGVNLQLGSAGTTSAAAWETTTYSFVVIKIGANTFINAASKVTFP